MLASFLLSLREGLEAAIILGIVLGVLRQTHQAHFSPTVWRGAVAAIITSVLIAIGLEWVGAEFEGQGEMIFEGLTFLLAAGLLTWMIFWMQKQARRMRSAIESDVLEKVRQTGRRGLFLVAYLSIVREGVELAVYLLAARLTSNPIEVLSGTLVGLATAAGLGWLAFATTRRFNFGTVFRVTNFFLILFAAGLITHSVHEFIEVGWISPIISPVWNLQPILPENSLLGQALSTLFGYNSNPALMEVVAFAAYLLVLGATWFILSRRKMGLERSA
jgi:high-affinity iron transporter